MDDRQLQQAIMSSYRSATQRSPMPSVPLRHAQQQQQHHHHQQQRRSSVQQQRRSSSSSRTDHGQSQDWKVERRAAAGHFRNPRNDTIQGARKSVSRSYNGHMSALERAGIVPAVPNRAASSVRRQNSSTHSSTHSSNSNSSQQARRQTASNNDVFSPPPPPPTSRPSPHLTSYGSTTDTSTLRASRRDKVRTETTGRMETCKDLGHGWVQRTAPKQVGTFKRAGTHTIAECRGGKFFICTREPASQDGEDSTVLCEALTTGQYNFDISVKPCAIANANRTHQRVHIIFGYRSPSQFLCLTQDADQNMWRIDAFRDEQQNNGRATLLVNVEDNMLRANRFSKVTIHCRGNVVAVTVGNRTLIQGLVVKDATQLCGAVGIACMRSKMIFKDAAVTTVAGGAKRRANNGTYGAGGGGGGGGGNQPPEARTRRDGSLMLPERMMRGASEAGLGNMEGGAYGHMRSLRGARIEEGSQQRDLGVSGHHQKGNQGNQGNDSRNRKEESRLVHGEKAPFVGDDRYLIDMIERDIINRQLGVKFEDIAGLEDAKRLLNEVSKYIFFSVSVSVSVSFSFSFSFSSPHKIPVPTHNHDIIVIQLFCHSGGFSTSSCAGIFYWNS